MEYESLKIRLQATGHGSYGVLASTATAEAANQFRPPFDERDLENFVLRVGRPRGGVRRLDSPEMNTAKAFGSELFEALFGHDVRDLYHAASAEADSAGKGLRITLLLGQTPELMHIPWEYLCEDGRFLSVSERTPIVRYLDLTKAHKPFRVKPPLRIVGMVSSPTDVVELNVEEEKRRLEHTLADLVASRYVELVWLEKATLRALLRALEEDAFHVFHYIGHGVFDEQAGDGVLMLEDDRGRGKPVTGMYLGQLLQDERTLQLAVLNACEGARSDREDAFGGVAANLVRNGIPSVVAMQFEITDDAAILFADGFYSALARGAPVDAAVASARKAIWADYNDIEWGTPVLFMRVLDGRIFEIDLDAVRTAQPATVAEDALGVALLADPDTVNAGDEVTWLLTITNRGSGTLFSITALSSDGSTLVEESELQPGQKSVTKWRTRPQKDADTTVTVRATDSRGDRLTEQVVAHVRVQPPVGAVERPAARREPAAERTAKGKTRPTGERSSKHHSEVPTPRPRPESAAEKSSVQRATDAHARKANRGKRSSATDAEKLPAATAGSSHVTATRLHAPGVDILHVARTLEAWYETQNLSAQVIESGEGDWAVVQAKSATWRRVVGMSSALTVVLRREGSDLAVEIGTARWTDKAVVGGVGVAFVVSPLVISTAIGAWRSFRLRHDTIEIVQSALASVSGADASPSNPSSK